MLQRIHLNAALKHLLAIPLMIASLAYGQEQSHLAKIEALNLEILKIEGITSYYAPSDRKRAEQLTMLSKEAATFFRQMLGLSLDLRMAALSPKQWFSPYGNSLPYGIPWASVTERLIIVPSSTTEGALIKDSNQSFNVRMIDFVSIHEFGHIANKQFFHPSSTYEEFPVLWFEELVATYFAYTFIHSKDPQWLDSAQKAWTVTVKEFTPRVLSLDWSFMRSLPGPELAQTYGWYQLFLNLRAAELFAEHGQNFLVKLREGLPLNEMDKWTTDLLLSHLELIAPGFRKWANNLESGIKKQE
ncbi:MAG TPA: hypothetical protein VJ765_00105 [Chitinophagaceae bacterium]|nr:hypothetical protein [Chitinophagaceae bacterium]